jgi:hypothetical protein
MLHRRQRRHMTEASCKTALTGTTGLSDGASGTSFGIVMIEIEIDLPIVLGVLSILTTTVSDVSGEQTTFQTQNVVTD